MRPSWRNSTRPATSTATLASAASRAKRFQGTAASSRRQSSLAPAADTAPSSTPGNTKFSRCHKASNGPTIDLPVHSVEDDLTPVKGRRTRNCPTNLTIAP